MTARRQPRLFIDQPLRPGEVLRPSEAQVHYLTHVMRVKTGEAVRVFNGRDGEWAACVDTVTKKGCTLRAETQNRPQAAEPDVWLAFAPIKRARIDLVVEKAAELGASVLWPVFTQHTNAERINLDRLRATALEAAEQCERLSVPDVRAASTLSDVIGQWPKQRLMFVLDETGAGRPIAAALRDAASQPCGFLVGPEGGFTAAELELLSSQAFVRRIGLGARILRAETAALSALAVWQSAVGDWR